MLNQTSESWEKEKARMETEARGVWQRIQVQLLAYFMDVCQARIDSLKNKIAISDEGKSMEDG